MQHPLIEASVHTSDAGGQWAGKKDENETKVGSGSAGEEEAFKYPLRDIFEPHSSRKRSIRRHHIRSSKKSDDASTIRHDWMLDSDPAAAHSFF